MKKVILHIESPDGSRSEHLGEELTLGRTDLSDIAVGDAGLSRRNTTFFRDEGQVLVVDEGSLNGTFLNSLQVSAPCPINDGDIIKVGSGTTIRVEFSDEQRTISQPVSPGGATVQLPPIIPVTQAAPARALSSRFPTMLIAAGILSFLIVIGAVLAILIVSLNRGTVANTSAGGPPVMLRSGLIPLRVVDPLGGENEDDLDDLIASWETAEKEIDATKVSDVAVAATDTADADLSVTAAFLADRQKKAFEPRNGETGIRPAGLNPPKELFGDGVIKQKAKLREMNGSGYQQPMDFAELAQKRLKKELIEMPMAAKSFYLDVGGSASDGPFASFNFQTGSAEIAPGSPKYESLATLAGDFSGQKYDLSNPADRKQMRIRLLRMFNPRAKPILQELAEAYFGKFGRPLRVTSLTRSMDYQIGLNSTNVNSFKVRGEGSLPPHTSGCAFDLARKHMTAEEQNFVMAKLAEMENANKLDALIEYGENACFHIFIYSDGLPPKM
jgi:pSer/pThr/pTyr-binding forkhead associated (FHA) protein